MLLTLAIPRLAFPQNPINIDEYKVIDQSRFIITYEAMMTEDSLKPAKQKFDRLVLMVGDLGLFTQTAPVPLPIMPAETFVQQVVGLM